MYEIYSNLKNFKFTFIFIFTSLLIFVNDSIGNINLFNILNLNIQNTVYKFELWRLFTYPFVNQNIFELTLSLIFGAYFISKFEKFVTTEYISITFVYFTLIFGLLHTVLNINTDTKSYFGAESFIIFCLINYIFIYEFERYYNYLFSRFISKNNDYKSNLENSFNNNFINKIKNFYKKSPSTNSKVPFTKLPILTFKELFLVYNIPILALSLWFFKEIYSYSTSINYNIYSCFIEFTFAIFAALILKNNVYVYENLDNLKIKANFEDADDIEEKTFAHSTINANKNSKVSNPKTQKAFKDEKHILEQYNNIFYENNYLYDNNTSEEEKIDGILDRINEIGKDKLTKEELNYLIKYSEKY